MYNNLVIRLHRSGRIKRPYFNIVVTRSFKSSKGGFIEKIGFYDPFSQKNSKDLNLLVVFSNRLKYWISKGAFPSNKVRNLLF